MLGEKKNDIAFGLCLAGMGASFNNAVTLYFQEGINNEVIYSSLACLTLSTIVVILLRR